VGVFREGAAGEVEVVGGTKKEDSFTTGKLMNSSGCRISDILPFGKVERLVSPGCCRARVGVPSVSIEQQNQYTGFITIMTCGIENSRSNYNPSTRLRDIAYVSDIRIDLIEPAVKLPRESWTVVSVPRASMAGLAYSHCIGL
jgi:hypothetical protein